MARQKVEVLKKLEGIRDLPTLPVVLEKLNAAVRDPKSDAEKLAGIMEDDPSMMTRILKVVNSPLYAGTERIDSLQLAIARMGLTAISNIALSTSVFSTFGGFGTVDFDRREFWKHSISTGIAVNVLYERYPSAARAPYTTDLLHLVGLLHDIGKVIFDQYFHDDFVEALKESRSLGIPLFHAELEHLETDHAQVGAWLGQKWLLAPPLLETIRWHHEPDNSKEEYRGIVMLCHVANYICNLVHLGDSGDDSAPAFFQGVWRKLGIDIEDVPDIIAKIRQESRKSEVLLSLM